jgi:segregation and condensation protein B
MEEPIQEAASRQPDTDETVRPAEGAPAPEGGAEPAAEAPPGAALPPESEPVSADELLGGATQPAGSAEAERARLKAVLEAVVYVLNEPMPAAQIAQALGRPLEEVEPLLQELAEDTVRPDRGIFIREVAGGYQMATKPEHHEVIRSFVRNLKQPLKLSQAALETLAVIAYKQPITMPEILEIRGVQGAGVIKTLIDRKLVTTAGRKNVVGRPILYKTTREFLTQFGLKDLSELPSLKEFEEIRRQSMADEEFEPAAEEASQPPETAASSDVQPVDPDSVEAESSGAPQEMDAAPAEPQAEPADEPASGEPEAAPPPEQQHG